MYTEAPQTGRQLTQEHFQIELVKEVLMSVAVNAMEDVPQINRPTGPTPRLLPSLACLTERHFPGCLDRQNNCIVCSGKKGKGDDHYIQLQPIYVCSTVF